MNEDNITEDDLIQAVRDALVAAPKSDALPWWEPNTISKSWFKHHFANKTDEDWRRVSRELKTKQMVSPAWIEYIDAWGTKQPIKGYRWVQ